MSKPTTEADLEDQAQAGLLDQAIFEPDIEIELAALQHRRDNLTEDRAKRAKLKKLEELRQGVAMLEAGASDDKTTTTNKASVNLQDLRMQQELVTAAKQQLDFIGLDDSSDSDAEKCSASGRKSRGKKSGIHSKSTDRVKFPQIWPHASFETEFAEKRACVDELSFDEFVAGETATILRQSASESERSGRLNLLTKLAYYKASYEWPALLKLYKTWLLQIELGKRDWQDSTQILELPILMHTVRVKKSQNVSSVKKVKAHDGEKGDRDETIWFCSLWQRNKCKQSSPHVLNVRGQSRSVQHICASYWLKDRVKRVHPECSSACPQNTDS